MLYFELLDSFVFKLSLQDHKTALMVACIEKIPDFVQLLIDNGADVNTKDCVSCNIDIVTDLRLH